MFFFLVMDRIWKYILFLVILETALLMYSFSLLLNNSTDLSNIRKRDKIPDDLKMKSNNTVETNEYASTFLAYFKKGLHMATENPNEMQRHNGKLKMKVSSKWRENFIISPILRYKGPSKRNDKTDNSKDDKFDKRNRFNIINGNDTYSSSLSNVPTENKTACAFSFDKDSLLKARMNLMKSFYLFYINLTINGIQHLTVEKQDNLMHWQYVKEDEKFLVQLPVDFDLLTYNLLVIDKEETHLEINVVYNNTNCSQDPSDLEKSVRLLLWSELFDNNKNYYLCNRNYTQVKNRNWLYYITTIWVGYDLKCSGMSYKGELKEFSLIKDHLPLVTPIFCYFLSLQFVWIFALLDVNVNQKDFSSDSVDENETNTVYSEQKPFYTREDRPYGLKRFVVKILNGTCFIKSPPIRLLTLIYVFILFPFGLYRTLGRSNILLKMYNNYLPVVRPSEPIFISICNLVYPKQVDLCIKRLDIAYAIGFPLIYIILGFISYKKFLSNDTKICCSASEGQVLFAKTRKISDGFTILFYQFCRECNVFFKCFSSFFINPTKCCSTTFQCRNCCNCSNKENGKEKESQIGKILGNIVSSILSFISCLFPIIPFICYRCSCSTCSPCSPCLWIAEIIFCITYVICIRPIISTFTFLLRSFTYFVFVALLIRVHILQFTLLFVSTFTYFLTYCHEIVNMNAEILKYIFDLQEEKHYIHSENEKIDHHFHTILEYIEKRQLIQSQTSETASREVSKTEGIEDELYDGIYDIHCYVSKLEEAQSSIQSQNLENTRVDNMSKDIYNGFFKILKYIYKLEKSKPSDILSHHSETSNINEKKVNKIEEEMFDYVYCKMMFVKKKFYFLFLKMVIVFMYLFITIETFITYKKSLNTSNLQAILEFLLIVFGPYAVSFFLKANNNDFLNEENKSEIKNGLKSFKLTKSNEKITKNGYINLSLNEDETEV